MKHLVSIILMLNSGFAFANESYVLIDAMHLSETSSQPTWLAFIKKGAGFVHIPTQKSIVAIEPGIYKLHHIDYQESASSGLGTIHYEELERITFQAKEKTITFVGIIEIKRIGGFKRKNYRTDVVPSELLVEWACSEKPEVFANLPVSFNGKEKGSKNVRVKCET